MDPEAIRQLATCPICGQEISECEEPFVNLNVACVKPTMFEGEPAYVMMTDAESLEFAIHVEVAYNAGEAEESRPRPRRRTVFTQVQLPAINGSQAEQNFCSIKCLRSWFDQLVDHVEENSKISTDRRNLEYRITTFPQQRRKRKS